MIVYMIRNKVNGMMYIGATTQSLKKRRITHLSHARNKNNDMVIAAAIREFGEDNFEWSIIEEVDNESDLERLEIYYIGYYDTYNNGYNQTIGGKGPTGFKHTEKAKENISKNHRDIKGKNNPGYGKCGKDNINAIGVKINGNQFDTITKAGKYLNVSRATVRNRIKAGWSGYEYKTVNLN